eukprot:CFRG3791T1
MVLLNLHEDIQGLLKNYREERAFNANDWVEKKCTAFNDYLRNCGLSACVVSVSGGVDSAVTLALCKFAEAMPNSPIKKVLAISQPIHSSDWALNRARETCESLGAEMKVIDQTAIHKQIQGVVDTACDVTGNAFATGQLRSYMRTPSAYYCAQLLSQQGTPCVVMGTGNMDEDGYLAYFCKAGDGVVDVQLIADLHKSEVFKVGYELNVPKSTLIAAPSADLWDGQEDEEELGFTYDFIELYTGKFLQLRTDEERDAYLSVLSTEGRKQWDSWSAAAVSIPALTAALCNVENERLQEVHCKQYARDKMAEVYIRVTVFHNDGQFNLGTAKPMLLSSYLPVEVAAVQAFNMMYGTNLIPGNPNVSVCLYHENGTRLTNLMGVSQNACLVVADGPFVPHTFKDCLPWRSDWDSNKIGNFLTGLVSANYQDEILSGSSSSEQVMLQSLKDLDVFFYSEHDNWLASLAAQGITPPQLTTPSSARSTQVSSTTPSTDSTVHKNENDKIKPDLSKFSYPSVMSWVNDNIIATPNPLSVQQSRSSCSSGEVFPECSTRSNSNMTNDSTFNGNSSATIDTMNFQRLVNNVQLPEIYMGKNPSMGRVTKKNTKQTKDRTADKLWREKVSDKLEDLKNSVPTLSEGKQRSTKITIFKTAREYLQKTMSENERLLEEVKRQKAELKARQNIGAGDFAVNTGVLILEQRMDMLEAGPVLIFADHHWKLMTGQLNPEGKRFQELCGVDKVPFMYSSCKVMNRTLFESRKVVWSGVMACLRSDGVIMACNAVIEPINLKESISDEGLCEEVSERDNNEGVVRSVVLCSNWFRFNMGDNIGPHVRASPSNSAEPLDSVSNSEHVSAHKSVNETTVAVE